MKKLLVVVDMQKDFVDGALGFEGAETIIPGILAKINEYKSNGDEVVYTLDTHSENYMNTQEGKNLPVIHCVKGSDGHKLVSELQDSLKDCKCFEKPTFGSLELGEYVNANKDEYEAIELCGLVSNICVVSNAIVCKAGAPEAEIIVNSNLTKSMDPVIHEKTMDVLRGVQVTVL